VDTFWFSKARDAFSVLLCLLTDSECKQFSAGLPVIAVLKSGFCVKCGCLVDMNRAAAIMGLLDVGRNGAMNAWAEPTLLSERAGRPRSQQETHYGMQEAAESEELYMYI
jgi:hypothetical protein